MTPLGPLIFGRVTFGRRQEHLEFQYRLLIVLLIGATVASLLFVLGALTGINPLVGRHVAITAGYCAVSFLLWLVLRGRKRRIWYVAWTFEAFCLMEFVAALWFVPEDQLRLLWLYLNVAAAYILTGRRGGLPITCLTIAGLVLLNPHMPAPYSGYAMLSALLGLAFFGVFFHIYVHQSQSYFVRMRESNQQLYVQATRDALTGVLNARAYYEMGEQMIRLAESAGSDYSVLFLDIDHFKSINDRYGHPAGDAVLKSVAACIAGTIRQSDALGRIGGEEFSVFLANTGLEAARGLAETLRREIELLEPQIGPGQTVRLTASIGVSGNRCGARSLHEIQRQADQAMYQSKKTGRNRVTLFRRDPDAASGQMPLRFIRPDA